jgi:uncharacterized protein
VNAYEPLSAHPGIDVELVPDRWTQPFWAAAREHRLVAARCSSCGAFRSPPTPFCPKCRSQEITWVELSGAAELYSFTIVRHPPAPELKDSVPYVIGIVKLAGADDVKFMTNVVNCTVDDVHIGMTLHVVWDDCGDDTFPRFGP